MVANPGCYPTSVQLPLVPLLEAGLILAEDIIIDAKSGAADAPQRQPPLLPQDEQQEQHECVAPAHRLRT